MRPNSAQVAGLQEPAKKRKHSVKKFVFSSPYKETETTTEEFNPDSIHRLKPRPKSSEYGFLNRYVKLEHLEVNKEERVCFIHNHKIVRATKVYVNIYHLWSKWLNRTLKTVGLGGGYHTAIEILGMEYHFGGCNQIDSGIFESRPLHQMRRLQYTNGSCISDFDLVASEMAREMGPLYKRQVIGLWTGSEADIDLLMRHLKEKGNWKGLNYKLLSFNCNHFVKDTCDILLKHSKHFHPAKGMTSSTKMVPSYLFKLGDVVKSKSQYLKCVIGAIDEETVPHPEEEHYAFRGRARFTSVGGRRSPFSTLFGVREDRDAENGSRRHSLPELRERRLRALDRSVRTDKEDSRQPSWNDPPKTSLDQPDPVDHYRYSGQNPTPTSGGCEIEPCIMSSSKCKITRQSLCKDQSALGVQHEVTPLIKGSTRTKTIKASTSRTDQILSLRRQLDLQDNFQTGGHRDRRLDCMHRRLMRSAEMDELSSQSLTEIKSPSPNSIKSGIRRGGTKSGCVEEPLMETLDMTMKLCSTNSVQREDDILVPL